MKRSGPLKRRKPLRSNAAAIKRWQSDGMRRQAAADPEAARILRARVGREAKEHDVWTEAKQTVKIRSRGLCEANWEGVCPPGDHRGEHVHHVVLRSQGGGHDPANLLHLCRKVHQHAHERDRLGAEARGIIARGSTARAWSDGLH